jgi:hypothetical protein
VNSPARTLSRATSISRWCSSRKYTQPSDYISRRNRSVYYLTIESRTPCGQFNGTYSDKSTSPASIKTVAQKICPRAAYRRNSIRDLFFVKKYQKGTIREF